MIQEEIERARNRFESRLQVEVEALLLSQGERVAHEVSKSSSVQDAMARAEEVAGDSSVAYEVLALIWGAVAPAFAQATYDGLAPKARTSSEWLARVLAFLAQDGANLVVGITDTTKDQIRDLLVQGIADGISARAMARRIRKELPQFSKVRAVRITRTEVIRASGIGALDGARDISSDFNIPMQKVWLTAPIMGNERDRHATYPGLDGQRRELNEPFSVNGYAAMYPADSNLPPAESINCRCTVVFEPAIKSFLDRRDLEMIKAYEPLKLELGSAYQARLELAERNAISVRQVERILWKRSRSD